ncbi:hypothetical protein HME9304_02520 [Flagellimonas maritima]|uniref:Uncharacterized protein n=1 Tax=Flagellimonas maritima TaxID=1383885 RepID=A0A2Z4LUX2_9FLAO|nr:hypothetical protein HME9304_02520 [Allomuricauda aurantiaca]
MIRDLKQLYTAIVDNEVVFFDTNLKLFVQKLNDAEPTSRNYQYYYRGFQKTNILTFENNGKQYFLQKLL